MLKIKDDTVEHVNNISNSKMTHVISPEEKSSRIDEKRAQLIKKIMDVKSDNKDDDRLENLHAKLF